MLINFWDCEYSEADEINYGTEDDPEYEWEYYCHHPNSKNNKCTLENKWSGDMSYCHLLKEGTTHGR